MLLPASAGLSQGRTCITVHQDRRGSSPGSSTGNCCRDRPPRRHGLSPALPARRPHCPPAAADAARGTPARVQHQPHVPGRAPGSDRSAENTAAAVQRWRRAIVWNEVPAIHSTLLERLCGTAKKRGLGTTGPIPRSLPVQAALAECLNRHMAYFRSKRSFCITLVHAATKSLTNLSCASSAA